MASLAPAEFCSISTRASISAFFRGAGASRELYERFSDFMDRFHVSGWRRWLVVEPLSEAATLGARRAGRGARAGVAGVPETSDEDWLRKTEVAVVFLDRYGNEVGSRGIKQNDAIALDELPDHLIKAVLATEDRRFFDHFGIDIAGTARALMTNARAGGVVQGGSSIIAAARQEPVPVERAHARAQGQGGVPGDLAGNAAHQVRDSRSCISTAPIWAAALTGSNAAVACTTSASRRGT